MSKRYNQGCFNQLVTLVKHTLTGVGDTDIENTFNEQAKLRANITTVRRTILNEVGGSENKTLHKVTILEDRDLILDTSHLLVFRGLLFRIINIEVKLGEYNYPNLVNIYCLEERPYKNIDVTIGTKESKGNHIAKNDNPLWL
jgi:hypothetical protein